MTVVSEAIALEGTEAVVQLPAGQPLKVGDHVNWSQCPNHCKDFAPFEIREIHGDSAKLDLFPNLVPLAQLEKCDRSAS